MEIPEDLKSKLADAGSHAASLFEGLTNLIQKQGLGGLLEQLQAKGLGETVKTWVAKGPNLPITPEQIKQALGSDQVRELAQRAGLSLEAASAKLSELLPGVIDKLTPNGKIDAEALLQKGLAFVKSSLSFGK